MGCCFPKDAERKKLLRKAAPNRLSTERGTLEGGAGSLSRLPTDLLRYVVFLLDVPSLGRLARVSRRFADLTDDDEVWKRHYGFFLFCEAGEKLGEETETTRHMSYKQRCARWIRLTHELGRDTSRRLSSLRRRSRMCFFSSWWKRKQVRVLFEGLNAAGKTTILYRFHLGHYIQVIPTMGFNVERIVHDRLEFTMWDVGGGCKIRPLLRHYFPGNQVIIVVIDSTFCDYLHQLADELEEWSSHSELAECIVAVLCNKQDLPGAMSVHEIACRAGFVRGRFDCWTWRVFPCSAYTGEGLKEALDWVALYF